MLWVINVVIQTITSTFNSPEKCMLVIVTPGTEEFIISFDHTQKVIFTREYMEIEKEPISTYLRNNVHCLLVLDFSNSNVQDLVHVSRKNLQQIIITIGKKKPSLQELSLAKYPIIWLNNDEKAVSTLMQEKETKVHIFCPKQTLSNSVWKTPFSGSLLKLPGGRARLFCNGYLKGQNVTRAGSYSAEARIINGKIVRGEFGVRVHQYLSEKYEYNPVNVMGPSIYFHHNNSWGGNQKLVQTGEALLASGRHNPQYHEHFELLIPFFEGRFGFISRKPIVVEKAYSILLPFSNTVWIMTITFLTIFAIIFYVTHFVYAETISNLGFHKRENSPTNFLLYTFCKITEPDPIPWFTEKWSAGKLLSFQWSLYCLLLVAIYNCNLRAFLSAVDYEKPIDTAQDVIDNGKRPWLMTELLANSITYLERSGQTGTPIYKIAEMAEKQGGYYGAMENQGLPVKALIDIFDNRAVAIKRTNMITREILFNPKYAHVLKGNKQLYVSKELAFSFLFCAVLQKHSPMRAEINKDFMDMVEHGLIYKWDNELYSAKHTMDLSKITRVNENKPKTLLQIVLPLSFCAAGWIVGMLTFVIESNYIL